MKKILYVVGIILIMIGCSRDTFEVYEPVSFVPKSLEISEPIGIRLQNVFVDNQVSINVKLDKETEVRLKIKDISGKLVSQEKLIAKAGDNILSIYTTSLDKSSYTVELTTESNSLLGSAVFVMN